MFQTVSFATFPVAERMEGGSDVPRMEGECGGLAGSGSALAGESKSLHLSEQSEEAWDR